MDDGATYCSITKRTIPISFIESLNYKFLAAHLSTVKISAQSRSPPKTINRLKTQTTQETYSLSVAPSLCSYLYARLRYVYPLSHLLPTVAAEEGLDL
jgi:hypothetical protein